MNLQSLTGLLKIGAVTFCGAFLGALTLTKFPSTLDEWKAAILPALGAGIASELVFLKQQMQLLTDTGAFQMKQPKKVSTPPLTVLTILALLGCGSCTKAQGTEIATVVSQSAPMFQCVLSQALGGNNDPASIAAACGGVAIADVALILNTLLAAESVDGGDKAVVAKLSVITVKANAMAGKKP